MRQDLQRQKDDLEMYLACQWLTSTDPHFSQCDPRQAYKDSLEERTAQAKGAELTRQELNETEMRCDNVVSESLTAGKRFSVRRGKLFLDIEGI